ncbi:flagellar filament capping protein FliD [Clostridium magnum]|uniref:Flagellar hook-associated protein 2 n=1 Tax=Clostridium magnum DSM 2767 TaxID=1121326 RepID=A0A162QVS2_9CLOT|nr:flagellar filament capping protein FliD [Clostridium magnum]KZL89037.1 flagellar hook-associated protein 2 [Clostridium magnum DSM 2767]SHI23117.1 flagellar hook-associated protein 2 [Clostridium magnum DSM 2767]
MYISNMVKVYSYYSRLWNNNGSTSNVPMVNSINQVVKSGYSNTESSSSTANNMSRLTSALTLKKDAEDLVNSAKKITNNTNSGTFAQKSASSEDSTKVTATAENGVYNTVYQIKVDQIATAQVNTGGAVDKNQISSVQAGTNTITIAAAGKSKDISFSVTAGDSNEAVLNKMAKAINDSQAGVKAVVVKNSSNNNINLQLTSDKTGTNNIFSITDKTGNAVASTGIDNISSKAVDAKYEINNVSYTANSNDVTTDRGRVTFTLKNSTTEAVKVTVKQDSSKIAEDINDFVESYNNLIEATNSNGMNNSNALKGITSLIDRNKSSLEKMGITINEDHTLSVDNKKLNDKIENDIKTVKDTFNGYQRVAVKIEYYSDSIARNPFTAAGVNILDVYNKSLIASYSYINEGSILNLYR